MRLAGRAGALPTRRAGQRLGLGLSALAVQVFPGAEKRYADLQALLADSGLDLKQRSAPIVQPRPQVAAPPFAVNYAPTLANNCRQRAFTGPRSAFTVMLGPQVRSFSVALWAASEDLVRPYLTAAAPASRPQAAPVPLTDLQLLGV